MANGILLRMRFSIVGSQNFLSWILKKLLSDSREEQLKADHVVEKLVKSICQMAKEKNV